MAREVMLVDDHDDFRELFADLVRRHGIQVTTSRNGREALAHLLTGARVGLILLDLFMPDMDGLQFLSHREAQEELRRIPVVVLTAVGSEIPDLRRFSVERVFEKPVSADLLLSVVRKYCRPELAGGGEG